jgi:NAD-dependent dihydropyrimidine dehydrogenase PreA subunit
MAYTGALKNLFGLVPGMIKTEYHKTYPATEGFGHMLVALHKTVKHRVAYHIMDGIVGMDGAGPSAGNPRNFGLLFGSASAPALDYIGATYMGFKLRDVGYLKEALHDEGIIPSQIEYPVSFNGFRLTGVDTRTASNRSHIMNYVPGFMRFFLRKLFVFYPFITDKCKSCLVCVKSCPVQTIKIGFDGVPAIFTDNCIRCLCCHEMCPYTAITIRKSAFARLFLG